MGWLRFTPIRFEKRASIRSVFAWERRVRPGQEELAEEIQSAIGMNRANLADAQFDSMR
jgi:hypothetical protein